MNADQKFQRARVQMILDQPFFGALLLGLRTSKDKNIPTMGTDGERLVWSPDFVDKLDEKEVCTVLCHEVMHAALLHPLRKQGRDHKKWNVACDYAANSVIESCNEEAKAKNQAIPFPWPKVAKPLLNPAYKGMSAEEIYNQLPDDPSGGDGAGDPGGLGEVLDGPQDPSQQQQQECSWKVQLQQAATVAKQQGKLPAEMERLVDEALNPKRSWKEILREFVTSVARDDFSWSRPNRRYLQSGFILPSLYSQRMGRLAVVIDTSGSIDQALLNEFVGEVEAICHECRPEKITIIDADAMVNSVREYEATDPLPRDFKGGGGTDFRCALEKLEEDPPVAAIYMTDLCGSFPNQEPSFPTLWATKEDGQAPFGVTIKLT